MSRSMYQPHLDGRDLLMFENPFDDVIDDDFQLLFFCLLNDCGFDFPLFIKFLLSTFPRMHIS